MSELRIGDLFVAIGFETDRADLKKVEKDIDGLAKRTEKKLQRATQIRPSVSHAQRREEFRREAALWRSEQIKKQRIHERGAIESHGRIRRAIAKRREAGVFGAGLGLGGMGGLAAGMGGMALLGDELSFDKQLTSLDVASRGAMGSVEKVRSSIVDTSNETGIAKDQILAGSAAFIRLTGDGKTAADTMKTFGRVVRATGSDAEDIAGTAAALSQQLGIGAQDFEQAFSILIAGGKAGAIELADMAKFSAELASQFKMFEGGTGVQGLSDMSAAFQIAAQSFGGKAPETATGLQRLFQSFTSKRTLKELKALKVEIFTIGKDGSAKLKSFPEIFEAMSKTDMIRDPRLLTKVFESSEARRAASAILGNVDAFKKLSKEIVHAKDVGEDYAKMMESRAGRVESAWTRAKNAFGGGANILIDKGLAITEGAGELAARALYAGENEPDAIKPTAADAKLSNQELDFKIRQLRASGGISSDSSKDPENIDLMRLRREQRRREKDYSGEIGRGLRLPTGERFRMDTFADREAAGLTAEPFRYETAKDRAAASFTTNITVNAPPGADGFGIANIVKQTIRQEMDRQARDIGAAGDQ